MNLGTATILQADARHLEQSINPLGKLPGSVWKIPTEPLNLPGHLGVDHFAAFPTEWPKRLIRGWAPIGICTVCGEPRRPVVDVEQETLRKVNTTGRPKRQDVGGLGGNGWNGVGYPATRSHATITGYACACTDASAETSPALILDPFGGTGTTAMVAKALGQHGISVDMSADYCRVARWRTNDRDQLAKVLGIPKAPVGSVGDDDLLGLLEAGA